MRRLFLVAVAAVGFASVTLAEKPSEAKYIPTNSPVAIFVDAVKLKKNLIDLGVPVEKAFAKAKTDKKVELDNISRIAVFLELFPDSGNPVAPAFIATMKEATAKADLPNLMESTTEATIAGKTCIKGKEKLAGQDSFGSAIDDKTLLIGVKSIMETLLKADAKEGDLSKEFEKADLKHDAVIVLAAKPLMAALKEKYGDLDKQIPPAAESFYLAAKTLEAATLTVDLSEETLLKGVFRSDSAEGAEKVKEALQGGLALASFGLPQIKQQLGGQLPPEAKPLIDVIEAIVKTSKFKIDGSTVIMTVARPKNFGK